MMLGVMVSCLDLLVSQVPPNSERCHVAAEVRNREADDDVWVSWCRAWIC